MKRKVAERVSVLYIYTFTTVNLSRSNLVNYVEQLAIIENLVIDVVVVVIGSY